MDLWLWLDQFCIVTIDSSIVSVIYSSATAKDRHIKNDREFQLLSHLFRYGSRLDHPLYNAFISHKFYRLLLGNECFSSFFL